MKSWLRFILAISARRLINDKSYSLFNITSLALAISFVSLALSWISLIYSSSLNWRDQHELYALQFRSGMAQTMFNSAQINSLRHALDFYKLANSSMELALAKRDETDFRFQPSDQTGKNERIAYYSYSTSLPKLLALRLSAGTLPEAGGDQVLVSAAFAKQHFYQPEQALQKVVYHGDQVWKIVGVLDADFTLPEPLAARRQGGLAAAVFVPSDFSREQASLTQQELFLNLSLFIRTKQATTTIEKFAYDFVRKQNSVSPVQVQLYSLPDFVIGDEVKTASLILYAALALAFTAFIGISLSNLARYLNRANEGFIRQALGAKPGQMRVFELTELGLIVLTAAFFALLMSSGLLYLTRAHLPLDYIQGLSYRLPLAIVACTVLSFLALGLLCLATNFVQAANSRAGLSPWMLRGLRAVLALQLVLALVIISVINLSLEGNWKALQASAGRDLQDLYWLGMEFPSSYSEASLREPLQNLKQQLMQTTQAPEAAIAYTDSAIRLRGVSDGYMGKEPDRQAVISENDDGSYQEVSTADQLNATTYSYFVSLIAAEANFPRMLGLALHSGRRYSESESNTVLLTQAAQRAIWGDVLPVGEEWLMPAARRLKSRKANWHHELRAVGVVKDGRISNAAEMMIADKLMPVVFIPLSNLEKEPRSFETLKLGILYRSKEELALSETQAQSLLAKAGLRPEQFKLSVLSQEARVYLLENLFSALLAVFLNCLVILTLVLGAIAAIHFTCHAQRAEIGVRLALGAHDASVYRLFFKRELLPHFILLGVLSSGSLLVSAIFLKGALLMPVVLSSLIIALALISGFVLAMRQVLHLSATTLLNQGE